MRDLRVVIYSSGSRCPHVWATQLTQLGLGIHVNPFLHNSIDGVSSMTEWSKAPADTSCIGLAYVSEAEKGIPVIAQTGIATIFTHVGDPENIIDNGDQQILKIFCGTI